MDNTTENQVDTTADTPAEPVIEAVSTEAPAVKTEVKAEAADYSWVPPKFVREGNPDFQAMAKSYVNLEKKIGSKGAMAPESVDDYVYEATKVAMDPEAGKAFKAEAQKAGLSTEQYKWVMTQYETEMEKFLPTPEKTEAYLKEQWGNNFDQNTGYMLRAIEAYVPSNIPIDVIGNNPYVLDILARIGAEMQEDTSPVRGAAPASGMTKDEVGAIMRDPNYYRDAKLQKQVSDWYAKNSK